MTQETSRPVAIVVEDDEGVRRSLQLLLSWRGYDVRAYAGAASFTTDVPAADILVADYRLPDGDGIGVLRALRRRGWTGRAVMITGHAGAGLKDAALASGFYAVLEKPVRQHELVGAIGR
jgi:FixJ family two-component response regulator